MMSIWLRIALILGAVLLLAYVMKKTRHADVQVPDTIFWLVLAALLVVVAIFPQICQFFAQLLGVESTANFVFVVVIAILIVRIFLSSMEISTLKGKINTLSQEIALRENDLKTAIEDIKEEEQA